MENNVHYGKGTGLLLASGKPVSVEGLSLGDFLLRADSTPVRVVAIEQSVQNVAFRLSPKIGDVVYLGGDHMLVLVSMAGPTRGKVTHMTACDYMQLPLKLRSGYNWFKRPVASFWCSGAVPTQPGSVDDPEEVMIMRSVAAPVELEAQAYLYGLLALGHATPERRAFAVATFRHTRLADGGAVDGAFLDTLLGDATVRERVLYGPSSVRAEFLAGALDASAYNRTTKRFDVLVETEGACSDLIFVAMSLGFYCSHIVNTRYSFALRKTVRSYTVYVYPNSNSCLPSRVFDLTPIKTQFSGIFSTDFALEQVYGKLETYSITVEAPVDSGGCNTGHGADLDIPNGLTHVFLGDFSIGVVGTRVGLGA